MSDKYSLTPVEHELMEILWEIGAGTVREVIAKLPKNRQLAYTSVSTMLRILQQKKWVKAEKLGKQHSYKPILTKEKFATHSVKKMVTDVFSGSPLEMVSYLVDKQPLSLDEIDAIQKLLDVKKRELAK